MTQPFDILVNGRPAMTLWACDADAAIIEAYVQGLTACDTDTVTAVPRIH